MSAATRTLHCCGCDASVDARLTSGVELYPHRPDLHELPFWKCDGCGNTVGCHHKTRDRTRPLGCIPTPELRQERQRIHRVLDPLWKSGKISRSKLYALIALKAGMTGGYHTAEITSVEQTRKIHRIVLELEGGQ